MSEISKMATAFEQRSKEQAENTEKAVKNALKKHENALLLALNESEKTTSDAIRVQSQRLKRTALSSWMAVAIPVIVTLALSAGAIWAMSWHMGSQIDQIQRYNVTLEQLKAEGGAIHLTECGKEELRMCVEIDTEAEAWGREGQFRILKGY